MFDYLIVGAGFAGSVLAERLASQLGKRVLVCDKRPHVGGNAYDCFDDAGILIHKYGPQVFHTSSPRIFDYLSQFTAWRPYEHRVLASVNGQLLPFPINVDTINRLYGTSMSPAEVQTFLAETKTRRELEELFFRDVARDVRMSYDDRFYTDEFQAMPLRGFTRMFENMLDHRNISLVLQTDYRDVVGEVPFREMIYSGPIDAFFGYRFGKLPYLSVELKFETRDVAVYQPAAVIAHPSEPLYTRVTELKWLTGQTHPKTTLVHEIPRADGEPYYPVLRPENIALHRRYKALGDSQGGVYFVGRLATYRNCEMDEVVGQSLDLFDRIAGVAPAEPEAA
ncbi:MAG TPA: UDP-galactopyranose mutase [Polyangiaceae bacterium]|jgi:UDP-galactopyranose mutase